MNIKNSNIIFFKFFKKYFFIIFIASIFVSSFHHHNDGKLHNDCPVYILQTNIAFSDAPQTTNYLTDIELVNEAILNSFSFTYSYKFKNQLHQRAPPKYS